MKDRNQFIAMQLRGQQGYAMAVLLVGMSVAAVLMTAVMPVWKQMTRREKETELVFRGQQYVRAIALFQKKSGPGVLPPNLDVLISGRFLRKKYNDPITGQDFDLLSPTQGAGQAGAVPGRGGAGQPSGGAIGSPPVQPSGSVIGAQSAGRGAVGGIIGVASKSKEPSLRIYNGRTHYNEWQFIFVQQAQAPAAGPGGAAGRGGQPIGTPQRGQAPPFGGTPGGFGRQGQGPGGRGGASPPFPPPGGPGAQPPFPPQRPQR